MDKPRPTTDKNTTNPKPIQSKGPSSLFSIVRNIDNCTLTVPTADSEQKYYQISIPEGPTIRIYFINQSIIRLRVCFDQDPSFMEQSYSLVMTAWEDRFDQLYKNIRKRVKPLVNVNFEEMETEADGKFYYFQTTQLSGRVYKNPYGIQILNKSGATIYKDLKGRAYKRDVQGRIYHYNEIDGSNDCFYGFGENTGKLNKAGQRIRLAPQDALGYDAQNSSPLYKHIPFYIKVNQKSRHAVGLFYNNTYEAVFDMGSQRSGYWPRYSYYCADGGDIDVFIINGPSIKRVIQRYTDLTGKTAMAPIQSLGYLGSTMYYAELEENCDQAIVQFVRKCKKENVPISNFHLSSGYTMSENKFAPKRYVFNWNSKKFPNPKQFFESMSDLGVSVSPNVKPGLLTTHHLYEQFASNLAFIKDRQNPNIPYVDRWWGGNGSFVDFTDKKAREIWKKHLKEQLITKGTTSIWNDNNQYESIDDRGALCSADSDQKWNGTVDEFKSVQSLIMSHVADEAVKEVNGEVRPYIVTRAGCAGIQRYASTWSGDNYSSWKTLKSNISTVLNMGLSGVANYGCDIGGFWGPAPEAQLFLRWVQHGIFQPRFSIHSCNSDNTVTEPWMYPQFSALIAKTIRLRYVLLPYLYSLLYFSHIKGRPIMRLLVYEFQDIDFQACAEESEEFMFGPYILVANVLESLTETKNFVPNSKTIVDLTSFPHINYFVPNCLELNENNPNLTYHHHQVYHHSHTENNEFSYKEIYLPKGCNWYSWNGRQKYPGGSTLVGKVGVESVPLFVKDRSIIPLAIKFGKGQASFDIAEMNRQVVTGLYVKIAFDENPETLKSNIKSKNNLEFIMFQDNGVSPLIQQSKKQQKEPAFQLQSERLLENRLNPQISPNSSYLLTKFTVRNPENKDNKLQPYNTKMVIIDINRQGNIENDNICTVDQMILEVKCLDNAPIWITANDGKCKRVLYETDWVKWKPSIVERIVGDNKKEEIEEPGCWYYDHEKASAIVKLHPSIVKPISEHHRNIHIRICKDKMVEFTKEYSNMVEEVEDNSQTRLKDQVIIEHDEIEEIIGGEEVKKIKERKRFIAKDNK